MREKILAILETNNKIELADVAVMLGVSEAEVANEVAKSVEKGTALIEVKVTPQRGNGFDAIAEKIYNYNEVHALYLMSGGFDFTVIIEGKTMKEVALFVANKLATQEQVLSTSTHFVLKKYKDHGTVVDVPQSDERMLVTP